MFSHPVLPILWSSLSLLFLPWHFFSASVLFSSYLLVALCLTIAALASFLWLIHLNYMEQAHTQQKLCIICISWCLFLQSNDNDERLQVVKLLAKMFGAKDSELAAQNKPLWQCYLGRWVSLYPLTVANTSAVYGGCCVLYYLVLTVFFFPVGLTTSMFLSDWSV